MNAAQSQLLVRLPSRLKLQVEQMARQSHHTTNAWVRSVLEDYVKEHDPGLYLQNLWDRIGLELEPRAKNPRYLASVIQEVRKAKHAENRH